MVSAPTAILENRLPLYVKNIHNPSFFPELFSQLQTIAIWLVTVILVLLPTPKPRTFLVTLPSNRLPLILFPSVPENPSAPF